MLCVSRTFFHINFCIILLEIKGIFLHILTTVLKDNAKYLFTIVLRFILDILCAGG